MQLANQKTEVGTVLNADSVVSAEGIWLQPADGKQAAQPTAGML